MAASLARARSTRSSGAYAASGVFLEMIPSRVRTIETDGRNIEREVRHESIHEARQVEAGGRGRRGDHEQREQTSHVAGINDRRSWQLES